MVATADGVSDAFSPVVTPRNAATQVAREAGKYKRRWIQAVNKNSKDGRHKSIMEGSCLPYQICAAR